MQRLKTEQSAAQTKGQGQQTVTAGLQELVGLVHSFACAPSCLLSAWLLFRIPCCVGKAAGLSCPLCCAYQQVSTQRVTAASSMNLKVMQCSLSWPGFYISRSAGAILKRRQSWQPG